MATVEHSVPPLSPYETDEKLQTVCTLPNRHMHLARCSHVACFEKNGHRPAKGMALCRMMILRPRSVYCVHHACLMAQRREQQLEAAR